MQKRTICSMRGNGVNAKIQRISDRDVQERIPMAEFLIWQMLFYLPLNWFSCDRVLRAVTISKKDRS